MPVSSGKREAVPCSCCGSSSFRKYLSCEGFDYVRCKFCSLVQINPQPLKSEIIERYNRIYGNEYLSYELENEQAFLNLQILALKDMKFDKFEKKLFSRYANDQPSVLDIGCATGALLFDLRERGWKVKGVEISPSAIYARKERNLDVRDIPLEEINFPSGSFDAVLASHLIEHLNDPCSFLLEVNRILKKDGLVFITTPNVSSFQAYFFGNRWRSAIFDHLYLFSFRTLKKMMKKCGFKIEAKKTWGGLAVGSAPQWLKRPIDKLAKIFGFGDVMIVKASKVTE